MLTAEQLDARKIGLGGSDAGAVLRLNPFKSPLDVYNDKLGLAPPDEESRFAYWGNRLEDLVAQEYARVTGKKVRRRNQMFIHKKHDFMLANVDRSVDGEKKILECKTANEYTKSKWGPSGSDEVPESYLIQCMHYMEVMNAKQADLAVLIGGSDFRIYNIDYDPKLVGMMIDREHDFWHNHVIKETPPQPYTLSELDAIYKDDNGEAATASDEDMLIHAELRSIADQKKELGKVEDALKTKIKRKLETAERLTDVDGYKLCTWKSQLRNTFDSKAFRVDHPNLFEQYKKESTVRVFKTY